MQCKIQGLKITTNSDLYSEERLVKMRIKSNPDASFQIFILYDESLNKHFIRRLKFGFCC